jgi:SAM-dependent methyltransferase
VNLPPKVLAVRRRIADTYLHGEGIEIGALYAPLQTSAKVRYVDRMPVEQLRVQYPELADTELTPVDCIDDGERLTTFANESLDFIIANHMLEHCENPLGTMRVHLERVRRGGILYYAVPDKRHSFDIDRPITTFEHLIDDDKDGGESSRVAHYMEWARLVNHIEAPADGILAGVTAKPGDIAGAYDAKAIEGQPQDLTLEKLRLRLEKNVYFAAPGQGWFKWGTSWARHQSYAGLNEFQSDLGIDADSEVLDPGFADVRQLDFRLRAEAMSLLKESYPRGPVPEVILGVR